MRRRRAEVAELSRTSFARIAALSVLLAGLSAALSAAPAREAVPAPAVPGTGACPDKFKAVCRNDCGGWTAGECGAHPAHNVAYALMQAV